MPTLELDADLERVWWACRECARTSLTPDGSFCHTWVSTIYERECGSGFHQSKMKKLARLGLLRENDSTRGGNRRYYTLA